MHKQIDNIYQNVKEITSKKDFEIQLNQILKSSDNLFDEITAAKLLVEKLGKNISNITKIKDIADEKEATIIGKITKIGNIRNFNKKNKKSGKVVNLEISDETGKCNLVLWDNDASLIKNKDIKIGSIVRVINGYIKNGYNGPEINIGKYGLIKIEKDIKLNISKKFNEIYGEIIEIQKTMPFFKDNGDYGFVTNIKLKVEGHIKKITLWDKKVKEIQSYKVGDKIKFEDIDIKNKNGIDEIHINGNSKFYKI